MDEYENAGLSDPTFSDEEQNTPPTMTTGRAQEIMASLLRMVRDARRPIKGVRVLRAWKGAEVQGHKPGALTVTVEEGAGMEPAGAETIAFDLPWTQDEEAAGLVAFPEMKGAVEALSGGAPVKLTFDDAAFRLNTAAWRTGDEVTARARFAGKNGTRTITGKAAIGPHLEMLASFARRLGLAPTEVLTLPLEETAARLAAGSVLIPIVKGSPSLLKRAVAQGTPLHAAILPER